MFKHNSIVLVVIHELKIKRKATYIPIHRLTNQKPNQYYVYSFILFYKFTTEIHVLMRHPMSGNRIKKDLFPHFQKISVPHYKPLPSLAISGAWGLVLSIAHRPIRVF